VRSAADPDEQALALLNAAVKRQAPGGGTVSIDVAREVCFGSLRAVLGALGAEGYRLNVAVTGRTATP
jgi:hypothetical protein